MLFTKRNENRAWSQVSNLRLHIHVVVNWQLSKQYPLTRITLSYRRISCQPIQFACFLKLSADKLLLFNDRRLKFNFLMHRKYVVFMSRTIFLGVHIRLLTRCKCKICVTLGQFGQFDHFIFSLKSLSLSLKSKVNWFVDLFTSLLFDLNHNFTNARLLALAKSIY